MRLIRKLRYQINSIRKGNSETRSWDEFKNELFENDPYLKSFLNGEITHICYCNKLDTAEYRRNVTRKRGIL